MVLPDHDIEDRQQLAHRSNDDDRNCLPLCLYPVIPDQSLRRDEHAQVPLVGRAQQAGQLGPEQFKGAIQRGEQFEGDITL